MTKVTCYSITVSSRASGITVEQRLTDGFINGTAMCLAYRKLIADFFRNQETIEYIEALAESLGLEFMCGKSHTSDISSIAASYPDLVTIRMGSSTIGGGTWIHPDLAVPLAQWCNPEFALLVSRN